METFSALLALCAGNSPVPGEFPAQRPMTQSFDVFFDLRRNKRLSKQSWGWWFETPPRPLWRHSNVLLNIFTFICGLSIYHHLQVINLLSDQGGQVGLWLGLSVLTLFEMVELLWDLLASVVFGGKGKPAPTSTDSKPPENISM